MLGFTIMSVMKFDSLAHIHANATNFGIRYNIIPIWPSALFSNENISIGQRQSAISLHSTKS